jgi:hypothetical protein
LSFGRRPYRRAVALALLVLQAAGCFRYSAASLASLPEGRPVRVRLTEAGLGRLAPEQRAQLPDQDPVLEGDLLQATAEGLLVAVPVSVNATGRFERTRAIYQRVSIPVQDVIGVELKQLDQKRTGLIAAGVGAVFVAFVVSYVTGVFGGSPTKPDDPPIELTGGGFAR